MYNLNIIILNADFFLLRVIPNSLRSLFKYKAFFIVYKRLNNSVFIINVVTVFYLFIF